MEYSNKAHYKKNAEILQVRFCLHSTPRVSVVIETSFPLFIFLSTIVDDRKVIKMRFSSSEAIAMRIKLISLAGDSETFAYFTISALIIKIYDCYQQPNQCFYSEKSIIELFLN